MADVVDINKVQLNMQRLKEILEDETKHLKANKPELLEDSYEEKLEVLYELEEQKKLLKESGVSPFKKDSAETQDLKDFAKEIDVTIETHGRHLIKAREVNKFMMEAISTAVQDQFKEVGLYDSSGRDGQYIPKGESSVPPVKINNTF